jgi:RNA ligase (TIGR02306 family)
MVRHLATIQEITNLAPIEGADKVVRASILGWNCVVKKDEFQMNGKCIFIEPDAVLPPRPEFDFLKEHKYRIKIRKFKGQISQGICFPTSLIPHEVSIGDDVTEELGIIKYEMPIPANLAGQVIGAFPSFMPKSDETRVQVLGDVLARHKGTMCYATEKIDGASLTAFVKDGQFGICSRNLQLAETEDNAYWKAARETQLKEKMLALNRNIMLQGELAGNGVQGNTLKLQGLHIFFFNAFDIDAYKYLDISEAFELFDSLGLEKVPLVLGSFELTDNIEELVKFATAKSLLNKDVWREGLVIRPLKEKQDLQMAQGFGNGRLSFKVINQEYALKYEG